jgi:hypothetical protein
VCILYGLVYTLCVLKSYVPEVLSLFASSRVERFGWFVERFGIDLSNIGFVKHIGMCFSRILHT